MKIAIIGFGATGLSAFIQIVERILKDPCFNVNEIIILSPKEEFIAGRAYLTPNGEHLLNTPARLMSCYPDNSLHFSDWLHAKGIKADYAPRYLFAQYLFEQYKTVKQLAVNHLITVTEILLKAIDIEINSKGSYLISLSDCTKIEVNIVIYTPGKPETPVLEKLGGSNSIFQFESHKDFPLDTCINTNGDVGILGSGLTAIDAIISINKHPKVKNIHVFSRTGLLPSVNQYNPNDTQWIKQPQYFTKNAIENLLISKKFTFNRVFKLLYKDLDEYPVHELNVGLQFLKNRNFTRYYEAIIPFAKRNYLPLKTLLASTRLYLIDLWHIASEDQKMAFERFSRHWQIFRHPIPYQTGLTIFDLLKSDKLHIHQIKKIDHDEKNVKVTTLYNSMIFPKFINAAGYGFNIQNSASCFDKRVIENGISNSNPFGGITVCRDTLQARPGFFAAGQIVRGIFYSTNAFWFNVLLTQRITNNLPGQIPGMIRHRITSNQIKIAYLKLPSI